MFNRKLNDSFLYTKLSFFIKYKARWLGILVIKISERNTSKLCRRRRKEGVRVGGSFKCPNYGYSSNADYNGAMSILKRVIRKSTPFRGGGCRHTFLKP